ncbi:MAG: hypothetical protein COT17_08065 [Elusimicrobia bacterium CG08_land_8_20_14_0_20_51_18]|nr:MAG: hypothetical protein COT17_08065 [Elusimicrobia bacterium CG08_land_8_20_14_0_20_51_18]
MRYKEYIPVEIFYSPVERPLWGRLLRLGAESCVLLSRYDFRKYRKLHLTFEFGGKKFENLSSRTVRMEKDRDGYYFYTCLPADAPAERHISDSGQAGRGQGRPSGRGSFPCFQ